MRVLIDSLGIQARIHNQDGKRLETFLQALRQVPGCVVCFSSPAPLSRVLLNDYDVLVITTRKKQDADYTQTELAAIPDFVRRGGGLLLMSNHGDIPGRSYPDMTASDAVLAFKFGIEIENSFFASPIWKKQVKISARNLRVDHPILSGVRCINPVRSVFTINCCSIKSGPGTPIISLPDMMMDYRDGRSHQSRYFAIAVDRGLDGMRGRIVVTTDSGFICSGETTYPGTGLIEKGDNRRLIVNILHWIGTR